MVRYVTPGETFGVAMAIGLQRYPATATAVDDSVALAWPSATWPRLVSRFPALATNTLQTVGSRLQETHTRVVEMSTQQVEQRVANALLRLAKQAGHKVEHGVEIDFPISRQDIAQMTGTTLHTVSRILSGWESRGLIESGRQRIVLREPHKLFVLAEEPPGASDPRWGRDGYKAADALNSLPLSGLNGHGRTCCWLEPPVAIAPSRTSL